MKAIEEEGDFQESERSSNRKSNSIISMTPSNALMKLPLTSVSLSNCIKILNEVKNNIKMKYLKLTIDVSMMFR